MPTLTDQSIRSIHSSLVEFGYPITLEWTRKTVSHLLNGGHVVGWLREAGIMKEEA